MRRVLIMIVALILAITPVVYAADKQVKVTLPKFDVIINGVIIDNGSEEYPFIVYEGITYIPMTWDLSNSLGLELKWNKEDGLSINKRDSMTLLVPKGKGSNSITKKYDASIVNFAVKVNGKSIDNSKAEYPLLSFRNVTYFPMTYAFMVKEFGSGYKWSNTTGLSVTADSNLEVKLPKPKTYEAEFSYQTILDNKARSEMLYMSSGVEETIIEVVSNENDDLDNYFYDLNVEFYDENNKLIYTEIVFIGEQYKSGEKSQYYGGYRKGISDPDLVYSKAKLKITFYHPLVFRTMNNLLNDEVKVEFISNSDISKELFSKDGGRYVDPIYLFKSELDVFSKEDVIYKVFKEGNNIIMPNGDHKKIILIGSGSGKLKAEFDDSNSSYLDLDRYKDFRYNDSYEYGNLETVPSDGDFGRSHHAFKVFDENNTLIRILINTDAIDYNK